MKLAKVAKCHLGPCVVVGQYSFMSSLISHVSAVTCFHSFAYTQFIMFHHLNPDPDPEVFMVNLKYSMSWKWIYAQHVWLLCKLFEFCLIYFGTIGNTHFVYFQFDIIGMIFTAWTSWYHVAPMWSIMNATHMWHHLETYVNTTCAKHCSHVKKFV